MIEKLFLKFIAWYFLSKKQTAVFEIDDKFVVRFFTKDFYNCDVIEALREYEWKNKRSEQQWNG